MDCVADHSAYIPPLIVDVDLKTEDLKQFVRRHSHIYIGLTGCIREFDEIANEFVNNYSTKAFELAMKKANQLIDGYDDEKVIIFYVVNRTLRIKIYFFPVEKHGKSLHNFNETRSRSWFGLCSRGKTSYCGNVG